MKAFIVMSGFMLLIIGLNYHIKKGKAYWLISATMPESKRKNVNWPGTANVLFYSSIIAFFIVLILGYIFQIYYNVSDIIFGRIFGAIVIIYALFVIIYSKRKYDHNN
jgi:hypothetical protein